MNTNAVYILTAEAKDLYNTNNLVRGDGKGYCIRKHDCDNINTKHFINAFDFSLDLIKLRDVYYSVFRNRNFSFFDGDKEYSRHIINVKFNYSLHDWNKAAHNIFVKSGYLLKDLELCNHVAFADGVLVAIEVGKPIEDVSSICSSELLGEYFYTEERTDVKTGETNIVYATNNKFEVLMTKAELRHYLYANGFDCDGIHYVRWKRSSGSSRVGKCLFINEALYKKMHKWETCGLKIKDGDEIDLAALEAYISLTSSSIIDTMELRPENFLIVDDYESVFKDKVMQVEFDDGELIAKEKECTISNSIFDGQSLLEESCFPEKYEKYSMLLLRQRMFKSACFKTRIQKWFADNNITNVSQLNGFTIAKNISDIKIITTKSSIKYVKFGSLQEWLNILEPIFGIVKHEKPTHYFDGRMVASHYQLINTLQLTKDDVELLLKPSLDYIKQVRQDPAVLRFHINYPYNEMEMTPALSKNEIIFKLLGINPEFAKTQMYYDFRDETVRALLKELKRGHVLIRGNYSTLLGNGYEMLQQSIGAFNGESVIGYGNIHSKKFEYDKKILGSRSPHVCAGNVLLVNNVACEKIDRYFALSKEVVYVNAINENIQQRLNGCDYDSDSILLTDEPLLIRAAEKNYYKFTVPTCFVEAKKIKRYYTREQQADLDIKTSVNKIGEDINFSQYLNSMLWQRVHDGDSIEDCKMLYEDICKLAVLSGIEIDKAKREYDVDTGKEINKLKLFYKKTKAERKWIPICQAEYDSLADTPKLRKVNDRGQYFRKIRRDKEIKPMFFKMITLGNGYALNEKHKYIYFDTPMDYVQKIVNGFSFYSYRENDKEVVPFANIVKPNNTHNMAITYWQSRDRILQFISDTQRQIRKMYIDYDSKTAEEKREVNMMVAIIKQDCINYINDAVLSDRTMYLLLQAIESKSGHRYKKFLFLSLFGAPNKSFFNFISSKKEMVEILEESDTGDINLFGIAYRKRKNIQKITV